MREWVEDTIDILFCNYIFHIVWDFPIYIHKAIRILFGVTCYQYSSMLDKKAYRWEFRKNPPIIFDIVNSRFGYTNIINETYADRFYSIGKKIIEEIEKNTKGE